jgi:hypothetical protein
MSERFFHDEFVCNLDKKYTTTHPNDVIAQNCQYRDNLSELQKQEGGFEDIKQVHFRQLLQGFNLFVACAVLGVLLYRQK